jgi:hypothetical protein
VFTQALIEQLALAISDPEETQAHPRVLPCAVLASVRALFGHLNFLECHEHRDAGARSIFRDGACWHMDVDVILSKFGPFDSNGFGSIFDNA